MTFDAIITGIFAGLFGGIGYHISGWVFDNYIKKRLEQAKNFEKEKLRQEADALIKRIDKAYRGQ